MVAFLLVGSAADAVSARCIRFRSGAAPLSNMLRAYARAASIQIIFDESAVANRPAPSIDEKACPDEIFAQLLQGTGLIVQRAGNDVFVITADRVQRLPPVAKEVVSSEIIVTSRKREERALDVPIALTVMSGLQLQRRGARSVADVLQEAPGVGAYEQGNGMVKVTIRGISTSLGSNENGYYLDDLPFTGVTVPINPDVRAWDLDRIEILRGPQGTLFGEGSMGGTVRILTRGADLDQWQAEGLAYASGTRDGGGNSGLKGLFNAPIVPGILAVRVAGTRERYSGWIDDAANARRNVNDQSFDMVRVRARFDPTDRLSFTANHWHYEGDFPGGGLATDAGQLSRSSRLGSRVRYELYGLTGRYDLGNAELFYSFSRNRLTLAQHGQFLDAPLVADIDVKVNAHELRLASTGQGAFQWTLGGYLRQARRRDDFLFALYGIDNVDFTRSRARAAFGEATYTLPGTAVDLTAGLRYFEEPVGGFEANDGVVTRDQGATYRSTNPRFSVAWHPVRDTTVYASAAKGFRAGQLQPTSSIALASQFGLALPRALRQDAIWTYEIGAKAALLGKALTVEGALYRSDWNDVAVRIPIAATGFNGLINSKGVKTTGGELGMSLMPMPGLTLTANASYIHATYSATVPGTGITKGAAVDDVARFSANASADYRADVAEGIVGSARIGWQHSSPRRYTAFGGYLPGDTIDRVDARLGIDLDRFGIALFVDNLLDDNGATNARSVQPIGQVDDIFAFRLRPRTIGVEASFRISGGS